jgi:hypothetical protein
MGNEAEDSYIGLRIGREVKPQLMVRYHSESTHLVSVPLTLRDPMGPIGSGPNTAKDGNKTSLPI